MCLKNEKIKAWLADKAAKAALKIANKAFTKLIENGKTLDLNGNDCNDLLEWNQWVEKALKNWNK